jgi:uncharacterized protein (TIGR02996 family)
MTDERAFIDALLWGQDADATALVYADWLEENGQPSRAALIRAEAEYHKQSSAEATQRLRECIKRCDAELPLSVALRKKLNLRWGRGLLESYLDGSLSEANLAELARVPFLTRLRYAETLPAERLAQLGRCPNICRLWHTALTDEQRRAVAGLTSVVELSLYERGIDDEQLTHLPGMKQLRGLEISGGQITDAGLAHVAPLVGLKRLSLIGCLQVSDAGLAHLAGLRGLEQLEMGSSEITDAGIAHLAGLRKLRSLTVWDSAMTGAGLAVICGLKKLTTLNIPGNRGIDDTHIMQVAKLPELRELDIGDTGVTRFRLPRLLAATKLKRIRTVASMATSPDSYEGREVQAFLETCAEHDVLVDMDYE